MEVLSGIAVDTWLIIEEASPWLLIGFIVAGFLKSLDLVGRFKKSFSGSGIRSVFTSTMIGIPLPLCSCSVIPLIHTMKQSGASKGATASFMTSTPQIGVDSFLITQGLFGSPMAIFRVVFAFFSAMIAGLCMKLLPEEESEEVQETRSACCTQKKSCCETDASSCETKAQNGNDGVLSLLKSSFHFSFVELPKELSSLLLLGFVLSGLISYVLPSGFIGQHLGNPYMQILLATLFSVPIYVCATSSTPVAASLVLKGLSPSAALVFLLAGPATNISTMLIARRALGNLGAFVYVMVIVTVALLAGLGIEFLSRAIGFTVLSANVHAHDHASYIHQLSGIFVLGLLLYPWLLRKKQHEDCCHS